MSVAVDMAEVEEDLNEAPKPTEGKGVARDTLNIISTTLSRVALDIAVSADEIKDVADIAQHDVQEFDGFVEQLIELQTTASEISNNISEANVVSNEANNEIKHSRETVESTNEQINKLIKAVEASDERLSQLNAALENVGNITNVINGIAKQTNLLALNATIEAARAGEAGKGFSVVANEVKALASSTSEATTQIEDTLAEIKNGFELLNSTSRETGRTAENVKECSSSFNEILEKVSGAIETIDRTNGIIDQQMEIVNATCSDFSAVSNKVSTNMKKSSSKLVEVSGTMRKVADDSDDLVLQSITSGTNKEEAKIINQASAAVELINTKISEAMASGAISEAELFDRNHEEVPGTDPVQHIAKFSKFVDQTFQDLIEDVVSTDERIKWCALIDDTAYISANILAVSKPQGSDPVWNTANCRNHRYFLDLTGRRSGMNQEPLLLQTYQRDMGGGNFVPMKDISAPIFINGRHWGGFRIGYTPE